MSKSKGHTCPHCKKYRLEKMYLKKSANRACRVCRMEYWRQYVSTPRGRERHLEAQKRYLLSPKGIRATKRARLKAKLKRELRA